MISYVDFVLPMFTLSVGLALGFIIGSLRKDVNTHRKLEERLKERDAAIKKLSDPELTYINNNNKVNF